MAVTIDWPVIDPDLIRPVEHPQLAGLQVANAVASSLFAAANPNNDADTEDRYARLIFPTLYRHKGITLGYGLKFWPGDFELLKAKTRTWRLLLKPKNIQTPGSNPYPYGLPPLPATSTNPALVCAINTPQESDVVGMTRLAFWILAESNEALQELRLRR